MLSYCPRIQLLSAAGIRLRDSDWWSRKMAMHTRSHDAVADWINDRFSDQYDVSLETPIYDSERRCGGHVDVIVVDGPIAHVIEIKTYVQLGKEGPSENSYWQKQISFYWGTLSDQPDYVVVIPVVLIATFDGKIRVIEPNVTDAYKDTLALLNIAWDTDVIPHYLDCYGEHDCKKCNLQPLCTEPITSVKEFVAEVRSRSHDE